jgi:predicted lactoylglutathione lyase
MLLDRDKFAGFTPRPVADATTATEVLLCLSLESREAVDAVVAAAASAGGTADPAPVQDHGFMYGRSIADPDGHIWELMWMDVAEFEQASGAVEHAGT